MIYILGFIHPGLNYAFYDELENRTYFGWSLIVSIIEFIISVLLIKNQQASFLNILMMVPIFQLGLLILFRSFYKKVFNKDLNLLDVVVYIESLGDWLLDVVFTMVYLVLPFLMAMYIYHLIK